MQRMRKGACPGPGVGSSADGQRREEAFKAGKVRTAFFFRHRRIGERNGMAIGIGRALLRKRHFHFTAGIIKAECRGNQA